jgi:hypothetical protein
MKGFRSIGWLLILAFLVGTVSEVWARPRTGTLEKIKIDGEKHEVFTDTVYGYTLTSPDGWDFKAQKEKGDDELNPFRLFARLKDKQMPTALWDSPSAVTPAQLYFFVVDLDWDPARVRDSIASPTANSHWQEPMVKNCDLLRDGEFLNSMDIRWEEGYKGAAFSLQKQYTAQVPSGGGTFQSVGEVLLGEFYVFPFREKILVVHLVSEREFLEENRATAKALVMEMGIQ